VENIKDIWTEITCCCLCGEHLLEWEIHPTDSEPTCADETSCRLRLNAQSASRLGTSLHKFAKDNHCKWIDKHQPSE